MIEMHISEIGFCSGHSASGVYVDEFARTTIPGLYAAGDMASVPHNYMLGAFTNGAVAGEHAIDFAKEVDFADFDQAVVPAEQERVHGADQARRRHPAEPDRIQDPPAGERLSPAAEGHAQDGAGAEALRRGARGHGRPRCMSATATS